MSNVKVLTFIAWYLPGYKGGGPIQALSNMINHLKNRVCFKVITSDFDLGEKKPYDSVISNAWQKNVNNIDVYYLSSDKFSFFSFYKLIKSTEYDVFYFNSFFSYVYTIKPLLLRYLGLFPHVPVVIGPRGEFSKGALAIKASKKQIYIKLFKAIGLYKEVIWQASSEYEMEDIKRIFGEGIKVVIAPDLPPVNNNVYDKYCYNQKIKGELKLVFLSRISRMKNLDGALKILRDIKGNVKFSIYGPIEDLNYWLECQKIIKVLPANVIVEYMGEIEHEQVAKVLKSQDMLYFPTLGENFGHVILEALLAGCPVILSDQTPWRYLTDKRIGWDISLCNLNDFKKIIENCIEMDQTIYDEFSKNAFNYASDYCNDNKIIQQNYLMFHNIANSIEIAKIK